MHDYTTGTLHRKVAKEVCAKASKGYKAIIDGLNELEIMVYKDQEM